MMSITCSWVPDGCDILHCDLGQHGEVFKLRKIGQF